MCHLYHGYVSHNQRVVLIFHPNHGMMIPLNLGPYPLVCLNHNDMINGEDNSWKAMTNPLEFGMPLFSQRNQYESATPSPEWVYRLAVRWSFEARAVLPCQLVGKKTPYTIYPIEQSNNLFFYKNESVFTDHTLAHPLNCRGRVAARPSA